MRIWAVSGRFTEEKRLKEKAVQETTDVQCQLVYSDDELEEPIDIIHRDDEKDHYGTVTKEGIQSVDDSDFSRSKLTREIKWLIEYNRNVVRDLPANLDPVSRHMISNSIINKHHLSETEKLEASEREKYSWVASRELQFINKSVVSA